MKGFNCAYLSVSHSPNKDILLKIQQYKFPKTLRRMTTQPPSTFKELVVHRTPQLMSLLRINIFKSPSEVSHITELYIYRSRRTVEAN